MSLIAWLPLTNDLNNQGASNMSFTSVSTTQNTFGKIGKSYTFGTSSSGARLYSNLFTPKSNSFSMCCWYKAAEGNSTSGYIMGLSRAQNADFMLYKNGTTGFRIYSNGGNTLYTHGIDITKWHHLVLTNNGTTTTLYIDGVSVKTRSTPTDYTLAQYRLFLGCRSNHADTTGAGSGYSNTGHYNDFRYYDHCLSAAEVHEISQGLVQHYKCDDLHNLITDNSAKTITVGASATSAYTNAYWYFDTRVKDYAYFKENTVYTVMYDYSVSLGGSSAYFYTQINGTRCVPNSAATQIRTSSTGTIVEQFKLNAAQAAYANTFRIRLRINSATGGDTATITNFRVYIGQASEYTKIIDSSGYGHNGAVTGTLLPMYNTPRYQWATSGGTGYATTDYVFDSTNLSSEFTWAGWIYRTNTDGTSGYIYSGTAVIYLYTSYDLRITWNQATADSSANNTWAPSQVMPLNTWTHAALTYKDGVLKVYVNGEYIKSNDRTASGTYMKGYKNNFLFSGASGANAFTGGLSDMRIYCTALSDADIKQLYELGAKVDNKNQWHAFEFQEGGTTAKIKKKGITLTNEVFEDVNMNNTAQVIKYDARSVALSNLKVLATKDRVTMTGSLNAIPAATITALKGKTLRLIYDVYAPGDRYSTEHGLTNWTDVRWGIHGDIDIVDSQGVSSYIYPLTNYLEYSGDAARLVDEWTIPADYQSFGDLIFQVQTFDKPASTNTSMWYLKNVRVEVAETTTYERVNASNLIEF